MLFDSVRETRTFGVRLLVPEFSGFQTVTALLAVVAAVALIRYKAGVIPVLAAAAGFGVVYSFVLDS
jgi:chromate transporter